MPVAKPRNRVSWTIPSPFFERSRGVGPNRNPVGKKPGFLGFSQKPGFLGVRVERMSVLAPPETRLAKNRVS
jgi:hypothetical protein